MWLFFNSSVIRNIFITVYVFTAVFLPHHNIHILSNDENNQDLKLERDSFKTLNCIAQRCVLLLMFPFFRWENRKAVQFNNKIYYVRWELRKISRSDVIVSKRFIVLMFSFLTFPACFYTQIIFFNLNSNWSTFLNVRNLQEPVKKAFCYQKLFWNCLKKMFKCSQKFCKFSTFSLDFFSITRTIFSHSVSEQFW